MSDPDLRPTAQQVLDDPWLNTPLSDSPFAEAVQTPSSLSDIKTQPSSAESLDLAVVADIVNVGYNLNEVTTGARDNASHIGRLYKKLTNHRK